MIVAKTEFSDGHRGGDGSGLHRLQTLCPMDEPGVLFVTRLKSNSNYGDVENRRPLVERNVLKDQLIRLTGPGAEKKCPYSVAVCGGLG